MKARPPRTSVSEHIEGVRLYLEDLEELLGLLTASGLSVRISDDAFDYDSFDEVQRKSGTSLPSISVEAKDTDSSRSVTLSFSNGHWSVHSYDKKLLGVAREVESLLRRRQTGIAHLPLYWFFQIGLLLLWAGSVAFKALPFLWVPLVTLGAGLWIAFACLALYWHLFPKIILRYKHNASFLSRNRDQILLILLGALIGVAIQWSITHLTR